MLMQGVVGDDGVAPNLAEQRRMGDVLTQLAEEQPQQFELSRIPQKAPLGPVIDPKLVLGDPELASRVGLDHGWHEWRGRVGGFGATDRVTRTGFLSANNLQQGIRWELP